MQTNEMYKMTPCCAVGYKNHNETDIQGALGDKSILL